MTLTTVKKVAFDIANNHLFLRPFCSRNNQWKYAVTMAIMTSHYDLPCLKKKSTSTSRGRRSDFGSTSKVMTRPVTSLGNDLWCRSEIRTTSVTHTRALLFQTWFREIKIIVPLPHFLHFNSILFVLGVWPIVFDFSCFCYNWYVLIYVIYLFASF